MIKIRTHSLSKPCAQDKESEKALCDCGEKATYWTQAENGEHPASQVIYHCQKCRDKARGKIATQLILGKEN